jgi:hypothetical protein
MTSGKQVELPSAGDTGSPLAGKRDLAVAWLLVTLPGAAAVVVGAISLVALRAGLVGQPALGEGIAGEIEGRFSTFLTAAGLVIGLVTLFVVRVVPGGQDNHDEQRREAE